MVVPVNAEAMAGVGVALLAVLVPLVLRGRVVAELGELRRDLQTDGDLGCPGQVADVTSARIRAA